MPEDVTGRCGEVGRAQFAVRRSTLRVFWTVTMARANLKALMDEACETHEPVIIRRHGADDVAIIAVDELRSLIETVHLLRSPKNAERLLRALARAQTGERRLRSLEKLRRDIGLDE